MVQGTGTGYRYRVQVQGTDTWYRYRVQVQCTGTVNRYMVQGTGYRYRVQVQGTQGSLLRSCNVFFFKPSLLYSICNWFLELGSIMAFPQPVVDPNREEAGRRGFGWFRSYFCRTQEGPAYTSLFNFHTFVCSLVRLLVSEIKFWSLHFH